MLKECMQWQMEPLKVQQGNGIMTIPVKEGQTKIKLSYTPPYFIY